MDDHSVLLFVLSTSSFNTSRNLSPYCIFLSDNGTDDIRATSYYQHVVVMSPVLMPLRHRWKEECQLVTSKFEAQISDLRGELADQKRRNDELVNLLRESKDRTLQVREHHKKHSVCHQNLKIHVT